MMPSSLSPHWSAQELSVVAIQKTQSAHAQNSSSVTTKSSSKKCLQGLLEIYSLGDVIKMMGKLFQHL